MQRRTFIYLLLGLSLGSCAQSTIPPLTGPAVVVFYTDN
jgi:hypothetical protein